MFFVYTIDSKRKIDLYKGVMMSIHLHKDMERVKKKIFELCTEVEENLRSAITAVKTKDEALRDEVLKRDGRVDEEEVVIEEELLKILALHQPVANDLRFLVAALKVNNDLERIGDLAVKIAKKTGRVTISEESGINMSAIFEAAVEMLKLSLDAFVKADVDLARKVCKLDDNVDNLNSKINELVRNKIRQNPDQVENNLIFSSIARNLERVGDHTTNIAEDVIYMVVGNIVRHGKFD